MFTSLGFKRFITSLLTVIIEVCRQIPVVAPYVGILETAAAALGATGVSHAVAAGTVTAYKTGSITSVLAILIAAAQYIPQLTPYLPILNLLATIFGAAAVGKGLSK